MSEPTPIPAAGDPPVPAATPTPAPDTTNLFGGKGVPTPAPSGSGESPWTLTDKGTFADGWLDRLPDEFKDSKQTLAAFKDPAAIAKGYVELKKMLGRKGDAVMPLTDKSTPEEIADYRAKFGIPDAPEKYDIKIDGVELDKEAVSKFASEVALKHNLTPTQARAAVEFQARLEADRAQQQQAAQVQQFESEKQLLAEAWAPEKYEVYQAQAERMAQTVGLPLNTAEWTPAKMVIALQRAAQLLSDDKLVSTESSPTFMTGEVKARDIMTNPENPYHKRWAKGDAEVKKLVADLIQSSRPVGKTGFSK